MPIFTLFFLALFVPFATQAGTILGAVAGLLTAILVAGPGCRSTPEPEIREIATALDDLGVRKIGPSHCSGDSAKRIEVDMEQYRKRREQALRNMAVRLGQKVKKKRKGATFIHRPG